MESSFNMENFLSNLISLASQPFDPQVLPALLEQVTNHRWERVGGRREEDTSETRIGQQNIEHSIAARTQVEEGSAALPNANDTSVDQSKKLILILPLWVVLVLSLSLLLLLPLPLPLTLPLTLPLQSVLLK
jgi:hypothetical protein